MSVLERLFGRHPKARPEARTCHPGADLPSTRPTDARRVGDTPMMCFRGEDGWVYLLDLDAFEYHYGDQSQQLPDPLQRDLDALLPRVTRVRVRSGGMLQGRALAWPVLIDTLDAAAIAALSTCLAIREAPGGSGHCCCLGGPTLELFAGSELVATIGIQHGDSIRWGRWRPDAPLRSDQISRWFVRKGIAPALLDVLYQNPFAMTRAPSEGATEPLSPADQKLFLAEILVGRNALAEAEAVCTDVLREDPRRGAAYAARAAIRQRRGELKGALADLTSALEVGGRDAELLFRRGVLLDETGRTAEADAALTEALTLDPAHANALNSRGVVRMRLGDPSAAKADLDEAIRLAPDWELPYVNRAQVDVMLGDSEAARNDCTVAIDKLTALGRAEQRPLLAALHSNRALLLDECGQVARAEADRQIARELEAGLKAPGS